jgi:hypothetical protein
MKATLSTRILAARRFLSVAALWAFWDVYASSIRSTVIPASPALYSIKASTLATSTLATSKLAIGPLVEALVHLRSV